VKQACPHGGDRGQGRQWLEDDFFVIVQRIEKKRLGGE
jgi:hypothetical protein